MNKKIVRFNIGGFGLFLTLFGIALYVGRFVYNVIGIPVLKVLYQLSKFLPEEKADPNPSASEKATNAVAHAVCNFVDTKIFKQPELECEKWTRNWEMWGSPAYKVTEVNETTNLN
jgi:hypothetical protein